MLAALLPPAGGVVAVVLLGVLCRAGALAVGSLGTGCSPGQFLYHLGCWGFLLAGLLTLSVIVCAAAVLAAGLGKGWGAPAAVAVAAIPWWAGALADLSSTRENASLEEMTFRLPLLETGALGREVGAWFGAALLIAVALGLAIALASGRDREQRRLVATWAAVAAGLGLTGVLAAFEARAVIALAGGVQEFGVGGAELPATISSFAAAGTWRLAGVALTVVLLLVLGAWLLRARSARTAAVVLVAVVVLTLGLDSLARRAAEREVDAVEALRASSAVEGALSPPAGSPPPS